MKHADKFNVQATPQGFVIECCWCGRRTEPTAILTAATVSAELEGWIALDGEYQSCLACGPALLDFLQDALRKKTAEYN